MSHARPLQAALWARRSSAAPPGCGARQTLPGRVGAGTRQTGREKKGQWVLLNTGLSGIPLSNRDQEMQVFQSGGAQISILMITGDICSLTWEEKLSPLLPSCSAHPPCPALGSQWLVTFLELPEEHLHVYGIRYISSHT